MANRKGNRLVPRRGQPAELAEEQQTAQARLRTAVFDGVSEGDVRDVVTGIVEKAKAGDRVALKFFFEYVLGGRVTTAIQNNYYVDGRGEGQPTGEMPGTAGKLSVLRQRADRGEDLFSTQDSVRDVG